MTKKERVFNAINHKKSDRVPKGETWIAGELSNKLLNADYPLDYLHFERDLKLRKMLNMDLINVGDWPSQPTGRTHNGYEVRLSNYGYEFIEAESKQIVKPPIDDIEDAHKYIKPDIKNVNPEIVKRFATESDLFVFAQIAGPVSALDEMFDMEDYFVYCMTNTAEIKEISEKVMEYEIEKAKLFIDNGADAIFLADDIAFNSGCFFPDTIMDELAFSFYKEAIKQIKAYKNVPVFGHSDGNLNKVLHKYVECGFDGLQSLQPSANMDIEKVKKEFGKDLCLWGNLDLDYLMTFGKPEEVRKEVRRVIDVAGKDGGYILSTCNTMIDAIPPENVLAMMEEADKY